jgi:hypothetical protein
MINKIQPKIIRQKSFSEKIKMKSSKTLQRVLMGIGPTDVDPRVLEALFRSSIGHLEPTFLDIN